MVTVLCTHYLSLVIKYSYQIMSISEWNVLENGDYPLAISLLALATFGEFITSIYFLTQFSRKDDDDLTKPIKIIVLTLLIKNVIKTPMMLYYVLKYCYKCSLCQSIFNPYAHVNNQELTEINGTNRMQQSTNMNANNKKYSFVNMFGYILCQTTSAVTHTFFAGDNTNNEYQFILLIYDEICFVCKGKFLSTEKWKKLYCGHLIHLHCEDESTSLSNTCAKCRIETQ